MDVSETKDKDTKINVKSNTLSYNTQTKNTRANNETKFL